MANATKVWVEVLFTGADVSLEDAEQKLDSALRACVRGGIIINSRVRHVQSVQYEPGDWDDEEDNENDYPPEEPEES